MNHNQKYVIIVWGFEKNRVDDQLRAADILASTIKVYDLNRPVEIWYGSDVDYEFENNTFDSIVKINPGPSKSWAIAHALEHLEWQEVIVFDPTCLVLTDLTYIWTSFRHDTWVVPRTSVDFRYQPIYSKYSFKVHKALADQNLNPVIGFPCYMKKSLELDQTLNKIQAIDEQWEDVRTILYGKETNITNDWDYYSSFVYSTDSIIRKDIGLNFVNFSKRDLLIDDRNWSKRSWLEFLNYFLIPGKNPTIKVENYVQLGILNYSDLDFVDQLEVWLEKR